MSGDGDKKGLICSAASEGAYSATQREEEKEFSLFSPFTVILPKEEITGRVSVSKGHPVRGIIKSRPDKKGIMRRNSCISRLVFNNLHHPLEMPDHPLSLVDECEWSCSRTLMDGRSADPEGNLLVS